MKKLAILTLIAASLFSAHSVARDDIGNYSIDNVIKSPTGQAKLGSDIKFYFSTQAHSGIAQTFGEFKTNKKTNAFNKTDEEACNWVFLSALIELKKRAIREGGNAVVNIKSNYKSNLTESTETFQCGAGTFVAGVALTGEVVKLK